MKTLCGNRFLGKIAEFYRFERIADRSKNVCRDETIIGTNLTQLNSWNVLCVGFTGPRSFS